MQKRGCLFLFLFFCLPVVPTLCFAADTSSVPSTINKSVSATISAERAPIITSVLGNTTATQGSMYYPSFYDAQPSADSYVFNCGQHLKNNVSGTANSANSNFVPIAGLSKQIIIPAELRGRSKILFTWTIRIETSAVTTPVESLCSAWTRPTYHPDYTFSQRLSGGQVETQLFINNIAQDPISTMTIPGLQPVNYTILAVVAPPPPPPCNSCWCSGGCGGGDPTLTGSCLIPSSSFPDGVLNVEVRWLNKMYGFLAVSPENMRQLVVTIIPDK